jgi:hypothetical protein
LINMSREFYTFSSVKTSSANPLFYALFFSRKVLGD